MAAQWQPGDPPTRDWGPIRATYWGKNSKTDVVEFQLGRFNRLARFFVSSRAIQVSGPEPVAGAPAGAGAPPAAV